MKLNYQNICTKVPSIKMCVVLCNLNHKTCSFVKFTVMFITKTESLFVCSSVDYSFYNICVL